MTFSRRGMRRRLASAPERGATAVLTIILLVPVLFAAAALSVDVGNLLSERRQLQNGADAAAFTAAQTCAEKPSLCPPSITSGPVATMANSNANDNMATVTSICGSAAARASSPGLTLCTAPASPGLTDCPTIPTAAANLPYVEVRTLTRTSTGSSTLINRFARIANRNAATNSVRACSRAGWGGVNPANLNVLPITVSYCDWTAATGYTGTPGSATYPPAPDYSINSYGYGGTNPWQTSWQRTIYTKGSPSTCSTWNGHVAPGGFSQLDTNTVCSVSTTNGAWYHGQPGNSTPCPSTSFAGLLGTVVYLPVFDCMTAAPTTITAATDCNSGSGSNLYYHVSGYAAFYLTGWYFSSTPQSSIVGGGLPCTGGDRCIEGWFLKDLISASDMASLINPTPGAPNYGLTSVAQLG
ncbi:pilus assembly protein TadG-related protein [Phycicoccus sp. M110.8]|uniref:pilus assembly protein TadG-related protein n=1 Tax=Phycicoccus sp. M110.8 TaxID=3075433 RepID=UPI0028FD647C|nr:pilus assembly protein TadG-related protein [Phycicoccus sp. M110.8]MDU0312661.1 pilus assembly protein TadG-related protein [Phycicoccus sp. M110.8]